MGWESKVEHQKLSSFCLFMTWMALPFALLFLYQLVVGFGFLSLLFTSLALLFSTIILYSWKHTSVPAVINSLVEENVLTCEENKSSNIERENIIEAMEMQEEEEESSDDSKLDGSISDEDSLIEITLPTRNFVDQQREEWRSLQQQQSLMEFLAEFNNEMYEEENLIEIDISMGSIKCSSFEIEAK